MELNDKDVKKIIVLGILIVLAVLTYMTVKPVIAALFWALVLAYLFVPLYSRIEYFVKNKTLAASIVSLILLTVILIPVWFLIPVIIPQISEVLTYAQEIDVHTIISSAFPSASEQFVRQIGLSLTGFISKMGQVGLEKLTNMLLELPSILLQVFIVCFVFFFTLRDHKKLTEFASGLSPFGESKGRALVKHFQNITDSVIYGHIIVGLVQGALAGIGFILFGIDNALVLTLLATIMSILPILGPFIVWVPIAIFMFATAPIEMAIAYLIYNVVVVSTADNVLRSYLVSRKTNLSAAFVFVGMMGGFFAFGITGLILGPLIVAYFLLLMEAYRSKTLSSLFADKESEVK